MQGSLSVICAVQFKIKMLLRMLKHKDFSFLLWPLSLDLLWCFCHSKERQIKNPNYWHEFYCSSLYCAFPLLNANRRTFNLHVESLKWHNLYFLAHTCICISFLSEQWKCCKKRPQRFLFCFFLDTRTFYQHFLSSAYRMSKEGLKGKRITCCPIFLFPSTSSFSA